MLNDKLRHIKMFESLFEQTSIPVGLVPNQKWLGDRIWQSLAGCLWLVVLRFQFPYLEAVTGSGSGLLTYAAQALEPPQSNGLLVQLI